MHDDEIAKINLLLEFISFARRSVCIFNHIPRVISDYYLNIVILVLMWGAMGGAFNILGGYAGEVCFIPPLFIGIGAYLSTWLLLRLNLSPWLGMLVGGIFCALLALGIGYLYFRYGLRDVYFALGTMALVMIAQTVFLNLPGFGGAEGLVILIEEDNPFMMKFREKLPLLFHLPGPGCSYPGVKLQDFKNKTGLLVSGDPRKPGSSRGSGCKCYALQATRHICDRFFPWIIGDILGSVRYFY